MDVFVRQDGILTCDGLKQITANSIYELIGMVEQFEQPNADHRRLLKFDNVEEIHLNFQDLMHLASRRRVKDVRGKTAIVCPNKLIYGIGRMWQSIMDETNLDIELFESEELAVEWLLAKVAAE